jgi:hypothetical protein
MMLVYPVQLMTEGMWAVLRIVTPKHPVMEYAGHDFWLTRNHHGAGFWDGDWEQSAGEKLTALAESFGEFNLYTHEGIIHGS